VVGFFAEFIDVNVMALAIKRFLGGFGDFDKGPFVQIRYRDLFLPYLRSLFVFLNLSLQGNIGLLTSLEARSQGGILGFQGNKAIASLS
jgi:hypothetical protein